MDTDGVFSVTLCHSQCPHCGVLLLVQFGQKMYSGF